MELTWIEEHKLLSLDVKDGFKRVEISWKVNYRGGDVRLEQGGEIIEKLFVFHEYFQVRSGSVER